jgi:hypothetical protein
MLGEPGGAILGRGEDSSPPVTEYEHPVPCCWVPDDQIFKVRWDGIWFEQWSS